MISVNHELTKIAENNPEDIQRFCYKNSRLYEPARLLKDQALIEESKHLSNNIITSLIYMFRIMITENKMVEFLNKQNLPFSIYLILVRSFAKNKF